MRRRQSNPESGFALLFVFVLAAGIAIAMLMQLPRVAFETARNREDMLIERGEQYKRAIALYYRKTSRLPTKIEDLESTNNIRFLRRRYIDPMTGKDEWRIIHAGPGGVLTDSLVKKAPSQALGPDGKPIDPKNGTQSGQNFGANPGNTVGSTPSPDAGPTVNSAVLRRPSDRIPVVAGQQGFDPSQQQPLYPGQPGYPQPGTPGYTGQPLYPGQPGYPQTATTGPGYGGAGSLPGQPGYPQPSQSSGPVYPGQPGYPQPGTPGYTGQAIYPGQPGYPQVTQNYNPQPVYQQQSQPIYPGQPGYPQPGTAGYTGQPIYPGQPGYSQAASNSGTQQGQPIYPGQPGYPQPGTPGYTGQPIYPGQPGYAQSAQQQNGQQPYNPMQNLPGVVTNPQGGFQQPGMPQQPGFNAAGNQPGFGNSGNAVSAINDLLRNPRTPPGGASAFNNSSIQGGIAGFATNFKGPSIKIYKERQKYQEWEFVYDIKDDPYLKRNNQGGGAGLGNANPGNTGMSNSSSFGNNSSSFGNNSSSFGSNSSGFGAGATQPPTPGRNP